MSQTNILSQSEKQMTMLDNLLQESIDSITALSSHLSVTSQNTFYAVPVDYSTIQLIDFQNVFKRS